MNIRIYSECQEEQIYEYIRLKKLAWIFTNMNIFGKKYLNIFECPNIHSIEAIYFPYKYFYLRPHKTQEGYSVKKVRNYLGHVGSLNFSKIPIELIPIQLSWFLSNWVDSYPIELIPFTPSRLLHLMLGYFPPPPLFIVKFRGNMLKYGWYSSIFQNS